MRSKTSPTKCSKTRPHEAQKRPDAAETTHDDDDNDDDDADNDDHVISTLERISSRLCPHSPAAPQS